MSPSPHRYGAAHKRERARWRPVVEAGEAWCAELICLMPSRWIHPRARWQLAHDRANGGYLGPAHAKCNESEGARYGNRKRGARRRLAKQPTTPPPSTRGRWVL